MIAFFAVALAGALGATSRYALDRFVSARVDARFPFGTLAVNLLGSAGLGVLVGLAALGLPPTLRLALGTGFFGAFTTFSTWMFQSVALFERGELGRGAANLVGSLLAGVLALGAGLAITTWLSS